MMTAQETTTQPFDIRIFPQLKPSHAQEGKQLVTCTTCHKPGYKYRKVNNNITSVYHVHYNELPIGVITLKGKPLRFKYRTCYKFGRVYQSMDEAVDSYSINKRVPEIPKNATINKARRKSVRIHCPICQKQGTAGVYTEKKYDNRPRYLVRHQENGKQRRCYDFTPEQREIVVKALGASHEIQKPREPKEKVKSGSKHNILTDKGKLVQLQDVIAKFIAEVQPLLKRSVGRPLKI
jgi:hypothetical protein